MGGMYGGWPWRSLEMHRPRDSLIRSYQGCTFFFFYGDRTMTGLPRPSDHLAPRQLASSPLLENNQFRHPRSAHHPSAKQGTQ